ncbi:membrane-associated protein, putative, partial [Bodo saltans]
PHTTLFSFVQSSTTLLLTGTGVVTQLLFVVISSTSTSGVWLAQVSAGCNLAVVGVSAVQMLIDMMSLLVAAKRRILTLSYRRSLEGQHRIESSSAAEMMLSVHTSSDFHQHPLQELYDEASSRSASNGHRSQVGRLSPTDLAVFREASPHHGGGGGRAVSWEGSFRGGGDSMRLKNMSMDSSSFLHHAEKKFWDRKGAAVSNGSFLFDAAVLGGRAVFVQQTSSPSPPGGASTTTTSAREHVGEDASRPSSSSQSIASPPSSPTTQIRTSGAPPTSSNQQQHPQGTPAASVVITSSSLQRGTAASTQQTKEAAAAAAIRSKATAATFTSSSSSEDDDEDL